MFDALIANVVMPPVAFLEIARVARAEIVAILKGQTGEILEGLLAVLALEKQPNHQKQTQQ